MECKKQVAKKNIVGQKCFHHLQSTTTNSMIRSVHIFIFHLNLPNLLRNTFYLETNNKIPDTYLDEFEIGEFLW